MRVSFVEMVWDKKKTDLHVRAANLLNRIKDEAFDYIRGNINVGEYEVQQFIHGKFKEYGFKKAEPQIVAFNSSAATPHYFPSKKKSKKLRKNSLVLIDIWGRLREKDCPFGDISWVGYYGDKIPKEIQMVYKLVIKARDASVNCILSGVKKGKLPTGKEVDDVARDIITKAGYGKNFIHTTGHGLGFSSPHWIGRNLSRKNSHQIFKKIGYAIEPGVYLKGKFGLRSEINLYVDSRGKVVFSSPVQKEIVRI
jgi:Xaa-Pro dipeptidase